MYYGTMVYGTVLCKYIYIFFIRRYSGRHPAVMGEW